MSGLAEEVGDTIVLPNDRNVQIGKFEGQQDRNFGMHSSHLVPSRGLTAPCLLPAIFANCLSVVTLSFSSWVPR